MYIAVNTNFALARKSQLWNGKKTKKQNTNSRLSVGDSLARCIEAGQPGLAWSWPLLSDGHLEGKLVNGASKPKGSPPSLPPAIWGLLLHLCSTYPMKTFPAGRWIVRGMRWVEGLHDPWLCLWWRMWQDVRFNISKCGANTSCSCSMALMMIERRQMSGQKSAVLLTDEQQHESLTMVLCCLIRSIILRLFFLMNSAGYLMCNLELFEN